MINGRNFSFSQVVDTGIYFRSPVPYYLSSGFENMDTFTYANDVQFAGSLITESDLAELVESCRIPIVVKISTVQYLAAKGFLAEIKGDGSIIPLILETHPNFGYKVELADIKSYISSKLFSDDFKELWAVGLAILKGHKGEVLIKPDIMEFFGAKFEMPQFNSIGERKAYLDNILGETLKSL